MQFKNFRGFTLLEMLTVIAIMGIMATIAFVSLRTTDSSTSLKSSQREIEATIKLAQSYALQGKGGLDGKTPCGFGFRFKDEDEYEIFYNPSGSCAEKNNPSDPDFISGYLHYRSGDSVTLQTYSLEGSVTMASSISSTEIYFTVPHGTIYNSGENIFTGTSFQISKAGEVKTVSVSSSGAIIDN